MIEQIRICHELSSNLYNELDELLSIFYDKEIDNYAEDIADFMSEIDALQDYLYGFIDNEEFNNR